MAAEVYTFRVTYDQLEEKIWRTIEVSSRYPMNKLGYCILATFDTMAYHLFSFSFRGQMYSIPSEWDESDGDGIDMAEARLDQLGLQPGDTLEMVYDFGTEQTFHLQLTAVSPMKRGAGTHYPYILAGEGRGILDDCPAEELAELIAQIDRSGKTDEEIFYNNCSFPWDYRKYSIKTDNSLLKYNIGEIEEGYLPFWED